MRGQSDMKRLLRILLPALLLASAPAAHAGQACADKPLTPNDVVRSMELARQTVQALDASGARVALVSRAGQD